VNVAILRWPNPWNIRQVVDVRGSGSVDLVTMREDVRVGEPARRVPSVPHTVSGRDAAARTDRSRSHRSSAPASGAPAAHAGVRLPIVPDVLRPRGRLPFPVGTFVGRADELTRAGAVLADRRLVTLTGSGGAGKTRMAIEMARRAEAGFGDGVRFVDLTSVQDERSVVDEIALALGVMEPERGGTLIEALVRELDGRDALIVIDGCEPVIGAVSQALTALLEGSNGLKVLATSREPLGIPGETVITVPPLEHADAVALFLERAGPADAPVNVDDTGLATIGRICDRLDRLPLAIELAAARARSLSLSRIEGALDDQIELLLRAAGPVPSRQRTLRASFDWSYALLSEPEARLLAELSVFRGGFGLDDAIAICHATSPEALSGLVERSLLSRSEDAGSGSAGELRYRMLETVREFAAERLGAQPRAADAVRRRHARHYLALAEAAVPHLTGFAQDAWLARLAVETDNLRVALDAWRETSDTDGLARMAVALTPYWLERSQWSECRRWLLAATELPGLSRVRHARLLNRRCYLEMWAGDVALVPVLVREALELLDGLDEATESGRAHGFRAIAISRAAGPEAARAETEQALQLLRAGGDRWGLAMLLAFFAAARLFQDRPDESRAMFDEAIAVATASGDRRTLRLAQGFAACASITQGRVEEATHQADSSLRAAAAADHATPMILSLLVQSWALIVGGEVEAARAAATECLALARRSEESPVLDGLALWAQAQVATAAGALDQATSSLVEACRLTAADRTWAALPALALAEVTAELNGPTAAAAPLRDAERIAETASQPWIAGRLALLRARLTDDPVRSDALVQEGVARARDAGDQLAVIDGLELLADMAEERHDDKVAVRLWAAASAAREALGYRRVLRREPGYRQRIGRATARLGPERTTTTWAEGAALTVDQAVAYGSRRHGRRRRPTTGWYSLTPAELEVAQLVAQHRSNPEIARLLFMSRATVKTHLVHIFAKLGIATRSELAAETIRRGAAGYAVEDP
jgi:predicted ATPase/DNA-binding CsgD family transcriptional regulator